MSLPERDGEEIRAMLEEDAYSDGERARSLDARRTALLLVPRQQQAGRDGRYSFCTGLRGRAGV